MKKDEQYQILLVRVLGVLLIAFSISIMEYWGAFIVSMGLGLLFVGVTFIKGK